MIAMEATTVETFLEYFEKVRGRTLRVISHIPPDMIEWTYREGRFTFGDLIRHLATIERFMYAENLMMRPSRYPGHGREHALGENHPVILQMPIGNGFTWCYAENRYL